MKDKPNKITATLKVVITGEFYDDEASEETLRYCVEQDLEDVGFDVDVELLEEQEDMGKELTDAIELIHKKNARIIELKDLLKEQEAVKPSIDEYGNKRCGCCGHKLQSIADRDLFCCKCGRSVKWE